MERADPSRQGARRRRWRLARAASLALAAAAGGRALVGLVLVPDGGLAGNSARGTGEIEACAVLAVALWLGARLCEPRAFARSRRVVRTVGEAWRGATVPRRIGLALALALLGIQIEAWVGGVAEVVAVGRRVATTPTPGMSWRPTSAHLPHLVRHVVTRSSADPVTVVVADEDPRVHQAAFYCYPRLLTMAPAQRAWSTLGRMTYTGVEDPLFTDPGPPPPVSVSRAAARARGEVLVRADATGAALVAPHAQEASLAQDSQEAPLAPDGKASRGVLAEGRP